MQDRFLSFGRGRRVFGPLLAAFCLWCAGAAVSAVSAADFPTPTDRTDMHALIARDFARYDPNYEKNKAARRQMLADMARRLFAFEAQGRNMACARQIFVEAKWLVGYTADWRRVDRRLKDLAKSLLQPDQAFAAAQSRTDGSWGACYEAWFMKVEATVDALGRLADRGETPQHPIRLLHPRHPLYVVPRPGGTFMLGATQIESTDRSSVTARAALELLSSAYALDPRFAEAEIVEMGADLRPAFPDNVPRIVRRGRVLHVNGLFRHGYLMAPALARQAAAYLADGHKGDLFHED